jgi:hypothetical protein
MRYNIRRGCQYRVLIGYSEVTADMWDLFSDRVASVVSSSAWEIRHVLDKLREDVRSESEFI